MVHEIHPTADHGLYNVCLMTVEFIVTKGVVEDIVGTLHGAYSATLLPAGVCIITDCWRITMSGMPSLRSDRCENTGSVV